MPLFSRIASYISPPLMRALRLSIFMDVSRLLADMPSAGSVADLGCGYGQIVSYLAQSRPDLQFTGLDIDDHAIGRAEQMWSLPNLRFTGATAVNSLGHFDLVLLLHVIHHVPIEGEQALIGHAANLLKPNGRLLIEEMEHGNCATGILLDTYVSNSPPLVRTDDQLRVLLGRQFKPVAWTRYKKSQIGRVYILAEKTNAPDVV